MSKNVYVNQGPDPLSATIDLAGVPEAIADRETDIGRGFLGLLDTLVGIENHVSREMIIGRRLEVIGSLAVMQDRLSVEGFDETIEGVLAGVDKVTTPRHADTAWIRYIVGRLTKETLPHLPDDTEFSDAVSELVRPFADATHDDAVAVHTGEVAFWLNVPQQAQAPKLEEIR